MKTVKKINLDLANHGIIPAVDAVQGDEMTRQIQMLLHSDGQAFNLTGNEMISVAFEKPDGKRGWYDTLPNGEPAVERDQYKDNVILVSLAPAMLEIPGVVKTALIFKNRDNHQIASFPFVVNVEKNLIEHSEISNEYYKLRTFDEFYEKLLSSFVFTTVTQELTSEQKEQARQNIGAAAFDMSTPYIISVYTGGNEPVIIGELNWNELVEAVISGRPVYCMTYDIIDETGNPIIGESYIETFLLSELYTEEGIAYFGERIGSAERRIKIEIDGSITKYFSSGIDKTLTKSWYAADAKETGDRISAASNENKRYVDENCVFYTEQNLSTAQMEQARKNIDAMQNGEADSDLSMNNYGIGEIRSLGFRSQNDGDDAVSIEQLNSITDENNNTQGVLFFSYPDGDGNVILRGVADGIESNDAATVGQLNAAVGDIETALDSIITIQNELIGGGAV